MKRFLKIIGMIALVIVTIVAAVTGIFIMRSGALKDRGPEQVTACVPVDGQGKAAEDILIDRERNVALLSWMDRRGAVTGNPTPGTVGRIDLNASEFKIEPATVADPPELRVHGMSLYVGPDGQRALFVISHPIGKPHRVEIFDANADGLYEHKQTLEDPLLFKPNDIAAVGPRQFYIANDSGAKGRLDRLRESLFGAAIADITYYDGAKFSVAYHGVAAPGGINTSADGSTVFVAETAGAKVSVFRRDAATGALTKMGETDLGSMPDNIDIAADGALWVAAHSNTIALVRQFADATRVAPTQVFRITHGNTFEVKQVHYNTGGLISAGSVAATTDTKMVLGSITDKKVLVCEKP